MQKLLCVLLASTVNAGEMFLQNKTPLDKDLISTKIDIDIAAADIIPCQYITQTSVFNFGNVNDPTKNAISTETEQLMVQQFSNGHKALFNFCEKSFSANGNQDLIGGQCDKADSNAFIGDTSAKTCESLNAMNDTEVGDTAGFEIMDAEGQIQGVSLIYQGGVCDTNTPYSLNVTSICPADGKSNKETPLIKDHFINGTCNYTVVYETPNGCPVFSLSQVTRFFYKYSYLFGAVLIVAGAFLAFFGNKFVNIVIFLVASFAVAITLSSLFINLALSKVDKEWVVWTAFVIILLVSFGVGALLVKFRKYGVAVFAGWGGVMLGFVVTTSFAVANVYAFYAIIVAAAIGMFFIAVKIEKTVIIMLTAFIGAYAFVRGISLYVGGFPSESELHAELEAKIITFDTMPKSYYAYLGGILLLFIVSTIYQFKSNKAKEKKRAELKTFMK